MKLHGKFRDTDHRWTTDIYQVVDYIFDPHQPILYKVNKPSKKKERVAYSRKQLQKVPENELDPNINVIRGKPNQYAVKKLLDKRKRGRNTERVFSMVEGLRKVR